LITVIIITFYVFIHLFIDSLSTNKHNNLVRTKENKENMASLAVGEENDGKKTYMIFI